MLRIARTTRTCRTLAGVAVAAASLFACADPATAPAASARLAATDAALHASARADAVAATVAWQATARALLTTHPSNPLVTTRAYALAAVAQYAALDAADFGGGEAQFQARRGAVGGAAVTVLSHLFPDAATSLEQQLAADGIGSSGRTHPQFARGVATGRAIGAAMRAWAASDGFATPWNGVRPTPGPGVWTAAAGVAPAGFQWPTMRPYFLTTQSQFRPPPPPAFGSPAFLADLAVVRHHSDTRTAQQTAIANFWNQSAGSPGTAGFWTARAGALAAAARLDERDAARLMALTTAAMHDATIGCWEAKYLYLLLRPSQADPAITFPVGPPGQPYGLPNHPSYPSGHSCVSSSAATVIANFFPAEAAALQAEVLEAGMSRVYGGIHYPFDVAAGQALGRAVAQWTIASEAAHGLPAALTQPVATP